MSQSAVSKAVSSFKGSVCSLSAVLNFIESKLMKHSGFSLVMQVNHVNFVKTTSARNWSIPVGTRVLGTGFTAASLLKKVEVLRHLHSLRLVLPPTACDQISSMSTSSQGNTDKPEDTEEANRNLMLWPVKIFLVYGFLLLTFKLLPLMSDSIVISGLKLCQSETDSSFHLVGLQRIGFYMQSQQVCKILFPGNNKENLNLADVLSKSLISRDQAIQDEALTLIEKVIDIWPESVDHLNKAGIAAILDNKRGLKLDGESAETQQKVIRILAALNKSSGD
jgi:hypothetical protein